MSDRWYLVYFEPSKWMRATVTSLQVGVLTMLLATPVGIMAALREFIDPTIAAISTNMLLVSTTLLLSTRLFSSRQK